MADDENQGKSKLDTADLKARLGLKKQKPAALAPHVPQPTTPPPSASGAGLDEDTEVDAGQASELVESVAEARRRSAEAAAEAGPALEDFSVIGQERTPLPQPLPGPDFTRVGAAESYPGMEKKRRLQMIALAVGVGIVAFLLGSMLSGASRENERRTSYILEARETKKTLEAQSAVLARISDLKEKVKVILGKIAALREQSAKDPKVLEPVFAELMGELGPYRDDKIYIDPEALIGEAIYNGTLMRDVIAFALRTRALYDRVNSGLDEMVSYARMARPPEVLTRGLLVEKDEREVEGIGKFPVARGVWIKDSGKPGEVDLTDPTTGQSVGKDWQILVMTEGATEPMQVPTAQVMTLDLKPIYDERIALAKEITFERLTTLATEIDRIASSINPAALMTEIDAWATKEP